MGEVGSREWFKSGQPCPENQIYTGETDYGGKRRVFSKDRKEESDFVLRIESGNKFQTVGAA